MRLRVGCQFDYECAAPVPMLMLVRARDEVDQQRRFESRWTDPELPVHDYLDGFDNACWRFTAPTGSFQLRYDALVEVSGEPDLVLPDAPLLAVEDLPDSVLVYTLGSRYIQSDLLVQTAWELFGETPPTWARV